MPRPAIPPPPPSVEKVIRGISDARSRHQERHRRSGFNFALADSIEFLNPAHWDALTKTASIFLQRPYLNTLEQSAPDNLFPRYALIYKGLKPVAAMAGQILCVSGEKLLPENNPEPSVKGAGWIKSAVKRTVNKVRSNALAKMHLQIFICGNFLSWGHHGVAFAPDENAADIWPGVAEAIYRIRRAEKLSGETDFAVVRDIPEDQADAARVLQRFSYRSYKSEPDMVLEFASSWRKYDDYLAGLNKKYRKAAKGFDKSLEQAGCKVERLKDLDLHAERLHQLYIQVHQRNALRLATLNPDYLPNLARNLGENFCCTVVKRNEDILGFVTTIKDRDTAVGYFIGYDEKTNAELPIYLRLLSAVISDALSMGCRRVTYGRTALEPKARLGAQPTPYKVVIRHRNPLINALIPNVLQGLIPNQQPPERNPFKDAPEEG
jgi:hypothetical protein